MSYDRKTMESFSEALRVVHAEGAPSSTRLAVAEATLQAATREVPAEDRDYLVTLLRAQMEAGASPPSAAAACRRISAEEWEIDLSAKQGAPSWGEELAEMLGRYFSGRAAESNWEALRGIRGEHREGDCGAKSRQVVEAPNGRLHVEWSEATAGAGRVRLREERGAADFFQLRRRGLTARECEVVFWLHQGKRDAEIATILGCASATASKHVENVLAKLGAETRLAAVNTALAWLKDL